MKKSKFAEEQIAFALRREEAGTPVPDIVSKLGAGEATFYRWKKRFGGMGIAELRRLRQLEGKNRKLKQLVADLGLDKKMLRDVLAKKPDPGPAPRRRRVPAGRLRIERAPRLRGAELPPGDPAVREPTRPTGRPAGPAE